MEGFLLISIQNQTKPLIQSFSPFILMLNKLVLKEMIEGLEEMVESDGVFCLPEDWCQLKQKN